MRTPLTLFEHLNNLTLYKKGWNDLTVEDKKSFKPYMINRFISMKMEYLDLVNEVQRYMNSNTDLSVFHKFWNTLLPKKKQFFYYIKGNKKTSVNPELVNILRDYYSESKKNTIEYIKMLSSDDLKSILSKMGLEEKKIQSLINYK